jgi:hypothetical protein
MWPDPVPPMIFRRSARAMEELRRARAAVAADENSRGPDGPLPYATSTRPRPADGSGLSPLMRRALLKVRTG